MSSIFLESFASTDILRKSVDPFRAGIQEHKKFITGQNRGIQDILWPYIYEREDLLTGWQHPNLVVPYLLNEIFEVSDRSKLSKIAAAYLACDHFTHVMDDLADEPVNGNPALLGHASHVLLSRGRNIYLSMSSDASAFLEFFDQYLENAMKGEQWLWGRKLTVAPYDVQDFEMLRARGCVINICLVAYCDIAERWDLWRPLEQALGQAAIGIQLLDDVVDIEQDFTNGTYTMPLSAAIRETNKTAPSWNDISFCLLRGNAWKETVDLAKEYLQRAHREFQEIGFSSGARMLSEIISNSEAFLRLDKQTATKLGSSNAAEMLSGILRQPIVRAMSH